MFKKGQRVIIKNYIDNELIGETGIVMNDSVPNKFEVVKLDKDSSIMYFWHTEIEELQVA